MARQAHQKAKLLYLKELLERTDEEHPVTMPEILEHLTRNGIDAERKSIYSDLETLEEYGMDIQRVRGRGPKSGYYTTDRKFELAELKLLVDAVQYSRFISRKKSRELTGKLIHLAKASEEKSLNRQIYGCSNTKSRNEKVYYSVDAIHEAIARDRQIRFHYFRWNLKKEQELRKGGDWYQVSPWALIWDDENYYLIAYDAEAGICKNYRVDKMLNLEQLPDRVREGRAAFDAMDIAAYTQRTFSMFAGRDTAVTLRCENSMVGVILDRFGVDHFLIPADEDHFDVHIRVEVSGPFFGWIFSLGGKVQITGPEDVREEMKEWAKRFL